MLKKSAAIDRLLRENPTLGKRRFGLPYIGARMDGEQFNPTVQVIADAIDFYGFEVRDEKIATCKDVDLGSGNPVCYKPFPLAIEEMKKSLDDYMYKYPYTEGDDAIRKVLLDYVEKEGFVNTEPYAYEDVDEKGLSVHNITFLPSTSIAFNMIVSVIAKPGDVILVTGPNYGLFTIRAERAGAEVEILPLCKEDGWKIHPQKLAHKIDSINQSLQMVYNRRKGYVPRVVAFLNANPNNPTGKVMGEKDKDLLYQIGEVCLKRGVFVIDDLVYRDIPFKEENKALPMASLNGMFRNTISLFGLSKCYGMASLRAGFVVADEIIIRELVNRIFQGMDSAPDIVGRALAGAFNPTPVRAKVYLEYFGPLREIYQDKFYLLKAMVQGNAQIEDEKAVKITAKVEKIIGKESAHTLLKGLPYIDFPENLEPEAGFFALIDFTKIKGMKYKGDTIRSERDLLTFFYKTSRTRFLVGQSISWPYEEELIGRVTFALEDEELIYAMENMHNALLKLAPADAYEIRENQLKDQRQMAAIKSKGFKTAYDIEIESKYAGKLSVEELTERYIQSFEEYKDLVLVASKGEEVLGYSCFALLEAKNPYDASLLSLSIKEGFTGMGIGTSLFKETCKKIGEKEKSNLIVWCFADSLEEIAFYETLGGKVVETKTVLIGDKYYEEKGIYFDIKTIMQSRF